MNSTIKSALNQISADEALKSRTATFLQNELSSSRESYFSKFIGHSKAMKIFAAAAAAVLVIAGGSAGAYAYYQTPVAYMSLDINPSVELGVNAFDKVVSAEAYNSDGANILDGLDLNGLTLQDAVESLVISADYKGYIAEDGSTVISLTSETNDTDAATNLQATAESGVTEALSAHSKEASVIKDNVAIARRNEAKELGITPGKLNLIQKLQAVMPEATVEEYMTTSVKDIMKTIQEKSIPEKAAAAHEKNQVQENATVTEQVTLHEKSADTDSVPSGKVKTGKSDPTFTNPNTAIEVAPSLTNEPSVSTSQDIQSIETPSAPYVKSEKTLESSVKEDVEEIEDKEDSEEAENKSEEYEKSSEIKSIEKPATSVPKNYGKTK